MQNSRFKHIELISKQGRQVLMVTRDVKRRSGSQQILTLAEPVTQDRSVKPLRDSPAAGWTFSGCSLRFIPHRRFEQDISRFWFKIDARLKAVH